MAINAVPMTVEMAFGFGPGSTPAPGDWVDVTSYVDVTASSTGVVATTGRDSVRSGIGPGTLTFTLENRDGRFNPRNASGPYYGELENGVQVRIRTTYASVTRTRWLGFVDSGWPQTITSRYPTVTITAHNLFGLMAQGEAPATAWDAFLKANPPSHIWTPGMDGWYDPVTGLVGRHTSKLEQLDGDPIIDGSDAPWGQDDPDGYGEVTATAARLDTATEAITVMARFRSKAGSAQPITLFKQTDLAGNYCTTEVTVFNDLVLVGCSNATHSRGAALTIYGLLDARPHTIMIHGAQGSGNLKVYVDGALVDDSVSTAFATTPTFGPLYFGTDPDAIPQTNYVGTIDPVVVWRGYTGNIDTLAAEGHAAASAPWTNERLDERVTNIVTGMGLSAHLGALDTSGIVTQQGYRQGSPLELLQNIEDTEQGRIWVDREGDLRFSKRSWAWDDTVSTTVQVTFSDDPTLIAGGAQEMLESGTVVSDDPLNIVNVASVNSTFGRQQTVEDATSIGKFGRRNAVQLSNLLHSSDRQSRSIAEWLILSQGTPQVQARQVSFRVEDNPAVLAPLAAQIEEGWLVRIRKLTTADTLDLYAHVIGIEHEWSFTGWTVTLTLDGTRTGFSFFKWGTSTWGGSAGWSF